MVGARTAVLEPDPPVDEVLGRYVELVVAQREVPPSTHLDLRSRELVQLSALLALPQEELDALIDRELLRLLGGPADTAEARSWLDRNRLLVIGGLVIASIAAAVGTAVLTGSTATTEIPTAEIPATGTELGGTVEIIDLPDGGTATRTESAPVPVAEDGTDIGSAVVIERNP